MHKRNCRDLDGREGQICERSSLAECPLLVRAVLSGLLGSGRGC